MADFGTKTGIAGTPIANVYDATPALTDRVPITGGRETAVQDIVDTAIALMDVDTGAMTEVLGRTVTNVRTARTLAEFATDIAADDAAMDTIHAEMQAREVEAPIELTATDVDYYQVIDNLGVASLITPDIAGQVSTVTASGAGAVARPLAAKDLDWLHAADWGGTATVFATLKARAGTRTGQQMIVAGYAAVGDGGGGLFVWDQASTATSDDGLVVAVTGVATGRWFRIYRPDAVSVAWFGAAKDAATINAAITAAAAAGIPRVVCDCAGAYTIARTGAAWTSLSLSIHPAVRLKSGVTLDLNGSTLTMAANGGSPMVGVGPDASGRTKIGLINGTINGDKANQEAGNSVYNVLFAECTGVLFDNVTIVDGLSAGCIAFNVTNAYIDRIDVANSEGDGFNLGQFGNTNQEWGFRDSWVGKISAESCGQDCDTGGKRSAYVGNSITFVGDNVTIDAMLTRNCRSGLKIMHNCRNSTIKYILVEGGALSTVNSGLKLQGDPPFNAEFYVQNVWIDEVVAKNNIAEGLYLFGTRNCWIGKYYGYRNATNTGTYDLTVHQYNEEMNIDYAKIEEACYGRSGTTYASYIRDDTVKDLRIGRISLVNGVGEYHRCFSIEGGTGTIDEVRLIDTKVTSNVDIGVYHPNNNRVTVKRISINKNLATIGYPIFIANGVTSYDIGPIHCDDAQPYGTVTLSAGTSTALSSNAIGRIYGGGVVEARPVIAVEPVNAAARTLLATGAIYAVANAGSTTPTATGGTIYHPTAAGTELVRWRVVEWISAPV